MSASFSPLTVGRFQGLTVHYSCHILYCKGHPADRGSVYLGQRLLAIFPMKDGVVRIISERAADDANERDPDLAEMQRCVEEMLPDGQWELSDPTWLAHFRFHCRGVDSYRKGRLFVAGDAAHIHSPVGGQGMNTGIQDAVNLGWKLGKVLRGEKQDSFLDSYMDERHPIGDHLLHGTDRVFNFTASQNPLWIMARNTILPIVAPILTKSRERRTRAFRFISELSIKYRKSPIVGTDPATNWPVKGGWRAPDGMIECGNEGNMRPLLEVCSPRSHTLLLFSGMAGGHLVPDKLQKVRREVNNSKRFGPIETITIYEPSADNKKAGYGDIDGQLHERYGMKNGGFVVLRPDLYIEYIGTLARWILFSATKCEILVWLSATVIARQMELRVCGSL